MIGVAICNLLFISKEKAIPNLGMARLFYFRNQLLNN